MDLESEDSENKSLIHKLKSKLNFTKSDNKAITTNNAEESRKKRSRIIQLVIVLMIAILIWDFLMPTEDETTPPEVVQVRPKYKKNKPKTAETTETKETAEAKESENPQPATAEGVATESTGTEAKQAEGTNSELPPETTTSTEAGTNPTESLEIENKVDESLQVSESPINETATPVPAESEINEDLTVDSSNDTITEKSQDIIDTNEKSSSESIITEQILEDLEKQAKKEIKEEEVKKDYVPPPDYEFVGRGLVYNCPGKHWACLDAPSFKICEDNASSVKYLKKKTECYPFNVYQTAKDCQFMQDRMVSSSAKTNFCNE